MDGSVWRVKVRFRGCDGMMLRFSNATTLITTEGKEFAEYYWNISTLRGSGEYALASLLSPGAWARRPLLNRLKELRPDLQVTAIYGQQDWMDYRHFLRVPWTERSAPVRTIAIPQAGHQLFLDNPSVFNKVLIMEMLEVKGQRARYGQRERDEGIKVWETSA